MIDIRTYMYDSNRRNGLLVNGYEFEKRVKRIGRRRGIEVRFQGRAKVQGTGLKRVVLHPEPFTLNPLSCEGKVCVTSIL